MAIAILQLGAPAWVEVRDPQAEEGEAEDQLREEGAAEAALHPEAAEAVAAVEWEESGDESREKRRVSRSEFPDGSWKWSKILSINLQASNSYAFCS